MHCIANIAEFNVTSDGWMEWRGNQYYLNRNSMYMDEARHFCQQRHGDLASINSKEENTFLWKQVHIYKLKLVPTVLENLYMHACVCSQISRTYGSYYIGLSVDIDGTFW